jgi:16S rRNA (cytosine1402-N4)-methyltransferase
VREGLDIRFELRSVLGTAKSERHPESGGEGWRSAVPRANSKKPRIQPFKQPFDLQSKLGASGVNVSTTFEHKPVLLNECLDLLQARPGASVLDGTLGGGGHASAFLQKTSPDGILIGLDVDEDALVAAEETLRPFGSRIKLVRSSFRQLDTALRSVDVEKVDIILLDLGVSSWQLDNAARGFRFGVDSAEEAPLDMRMDQRNPMTAADLLQNSTAEDLQNWFSRYGELPGSKKLARAIVERRDSTPFLYAQDLLTLIEELRIGKGRKHNPATLVFQALRIALNDEMGALEEGLAKAIDHLTPGGRLGVISYHSLEDRIAKNVIRDAVKGCVCPPRTPMCICGQLPRLNKVTRKTVVASEDEMKTNPRARSARLRVAERLPEAV